MYKDINARLPFINVTHNHRCFDNTCIPHISRVLLSIRFYSHS